MKRCEYTTVASYLQAIGILSCNYIIKVGNHYLVPELEWQVWPCLGWFYELSFHYTYFEPTLGVFVLWCYILVPLPPAFARLFINCFRSLYFFLCVSLCRGVYDPLSMSEMVFPFSTFSLPLRLIYFLYVFFVSHCIVTLSFSIDRSIFIDFRWSHSLWGCLYAPCPLFSILLMT